MLLLHFSGQRPPDEAVYADKMDVAISSTSSGPHSYNVINQRHSQQTTMMSDDRAPRVKPPRSSE